MHASLDRERAKLELRAARLLTTIDDDLGAPDRQAEIILAGYCCRERIGMGTRRALFRNSLTRRKMVRSGAENYTATWSHGYLESSTAILAVQMRHPLHGNVALIPYQ